MTALQVPNSCAQATKDPMWIDCMNQELKELDKNNTWTLVYTPTHKNIVGCSWKYKVKYNPDRTINKPKSQLVAQGFTQVEGVNSHESFSSVAKWQTICILIHMATVHQWPLHQTDINTTFLHGYLSEEIYMKPPRYSKAKPSQVCKLQKQVTYYLI